MGGVDQRLAVRAAIAGVAALTGVYFLLGEPLTPATIWRLIPGILLFGVGAPATYYCVERIRSGDKTRIHDEIVRQERKRVEIEELKYGKTSKD